MPRVAFPLKYIDEAPIIDGVVGETQNKKETLESK